MRTIHPVPSALSAVLVASSLTCLLLGALAAPAAAQTAPGLRFQAEQRGDFLIFGNTVGFDCRLESPVPDPLVGAVSRTPASCLSPEFAATGTASAIAGALNDTAVDVFWRSDFPTEGQVSIVKTAAEARTTAVLTLPSDASVTYARIYWSAGVRPPATAGSTVLIERPGAFMQTVPADASFTAGSQEQGVDLTIYQSSADITRLLQRHGAGAYRVGGIASTELLDARLDVTEITWSVVVFYRRDADPPRNLALFDGLFTVFKNSITGQESQASALLQGFVVPTGAFDAKLGVIAYEGDVGGGGDYVQVNDQKLSNAQNPENDFFNATRSVLGVAQSIAGDLPQMSGAPGSMNGYDVDIVDMSSVLKAGDTSAQLKAGTLSDNFFLGAFVTSVGTLKPIFDSKLSVADLTNPGPPPSFSPGDQLEFTLETRNIGNDTGVGAYVDIQLPPGVTYEPGSLVIVSGEGAGQKSDSPLNDQAEYLPGSRIVRVRLGKGADGSKGGSVAPGDEATVVKFRARIDADAKGKLVTQAVVTASGEQGVAKGVPPYRFVSTDTTPAGPAGTGGPGSPTTIVVSECESDGTCAGRAQGVACTADKVCGCRSNQDCAAPAACDVLRGECRLLPSDLQILVVTEPTDGKPVGVAPVRYAVQVTNLGPGAAPGARIEVTLPEGAIVENIVPGDGWTCTAPEQRPVVCVRKTPLGSGERAPEIIITVTPGNVDGAVILEAVPANKDGVPASPTGLSAADPDAGNNVVILRLDGTGTFRAAGGGFGCALAGAGEGGASAAALGALLAALLLGRRRRR